MHPNVSKMLADLRNQHAMIEESIVTLERLANSGGKRRGRPPKWLIAAAAKRRGRPPSSKNKPKADASMA